MNRNRLFGALALTVTAVAGAAAAPQMDHEKHMAMLKRGEKAMGFDQTRTSHHFRLSPDGGTIEVRANDPRDAALRGQVVAHLTMIAGQFSRGDFSTPVAVHGEEPAGVAALKRFGAQISYTFVPDDAGGRVVISTKSKDAVAAVHDFLRYQIREHHTGDPMKEEF